MPALDFILPTAKVVAPGDGGTAASSAGDRAAGESFDQVMTRALSPSETDESTGSGRPDAVSTAGDEGKQNTVSTPSPRRRLQARNAVSKNAVSAAGETDDSSVSPSGVKSPAQTPETDDGKGGGDVVAGSSSPKETQAASAGVFGVMAQMAALPAGVIPQLSSAVEKEGVPDTEAVSDAPSSSMSAAAAGSGAPEALVARSGTEAGSSSNETVSDKAGAELISRLKPSGPQKKAVKTDDPAAGKTKSSDSPSAASADDSAIPEFSAADLSEPEPGSGPMVCLLQNGIAPATDSSAETTAPVPPEIRDSSGGKINLSDSSSASSPQNAAVSSTDSSSETTTPLSPEIRGTSVAKLYMPMEKTEKMNKVAGSTAKTEKVLPGDAGLTALENNLPATDTVARMVLGNESAAIITGPSTGESGSAAVSAANGFASPVVDLQSRALERTHDMIALQAVHMNDSKLDSLHVVIKPGAGMQLSLEMRQHGDAVDAQAVLQRGDFGQLSQHWPELQQRLEERGVRLAPLAGGENSTADCGTNGFQQPHREFAGQDSIEASAFAEFALASAAIQSTTPATGVAAIRRGWETWA